MYITFGNNNEHIACCLSQTDVQWEKQGQNIQVIKVQPLSSKNTVEIRRIVFTYFKNNTTKYSSNSNHPSYDSKNYPSYHIRDSLSNFTGEKLNLQVALCIFYENSVRIQLENGENTIIDLGFQESCAIRLKTGLLIQQKNYKQHNVKLFILRSFFSCIEELSIIHLSEKSLLSKFEAIDNNYLRLKSFENTNLLDQDFELVSSFFINAEPFQRIVIYNRNNNSYCLYSLIKGENLIDHTTLQSDSKYTKKSFGTSNLIYEPTLFPSTQNLIPFSNYNHDNILFDKSTTYQLSLLNLEIPNHKNTFLGRASVNDSPVLRTHKPSKTSISIDSNRTYICADWKESHNFNHSPSTNLTDNGTTKALLIDWFDQSKALVVLHSKHAIANVYSLLNYCLLFSTDAKNIFLYRLSFEKNTYSFCAIKSDESIFLVLGKNMQVNISSTFKNNSNYPNKKIENFSFFFSENKFIIPSIVKLELKIKSRAIRSLLYIMLQKETFAVYQHLSYIIFLAISYNPKLSQSKEREIFLDSINTFFKENDTTPNFEQTTLYLFFQFNFVYENYKLYSEANIDDKLFISKVVFLIAQFANQERFVLYCKSKNINIKILNFIKMNSTRNLNHTSCFLKYVEIILHLNHFNFLENQSKIPHITIFPDNLDKKEILPINFIDCPTLSSLYFAELIIKEFFSTFSDNDDTKNMLETDPNFNASKHNFLGDINHNVRIYGYQMILPLMALEIDKILFKIKKNFTNVNALTGDAGLNKNYSQHKSIDENDFNSWLKIQNSTKNPFEKDMRIKELESRVNSDSFTDLKTIYSLKTEQNQVGNSNTEFIESASLYFTFLQTLTAPMGRAGYTLRSLNIKLDEILSVPDLVLAVKIKSLKNLKASIDYCVPEELILLGTFANGVASSLSINQEDLERLQPNWILLNKPKNLQSITSGTIIGDETYTDAVKAYNISITTFSGLIFGLGLHESINNPLKKMPAWRMIQYFDMKIDILTSSFLLGRACCFLGKGYDDISTVELLQLHIPRLAECNTQESQSTITPSSVSKTIQTASILGLGLVFKGLANKKISYFLISQLCSTETVHIEEYDLHLNKDLELYKSYLLNTGLSLGLILLNSGNKFRFVAGGSEITLFDILYPVINSKGHTDNSSTRNQTNIKSMYKQMAKPAALLALSLCYINTSDETLLTFLLKVIKRQKNFKKITNELLLIYSISQWLISMNTLEPSVKFILQNSLLNDSLDQLFVHFNVNNLQSLENCNGITNFLKFKTTNHKILEMKRAFLINTTGMCFVLSLKFAGTQSKKAKNTILIIFDTFLSSGDIDVMSRLRLMDNNISKFIHQGYIKYLIENTQDLRFEDYQSTSQYTHQNNFGHSIFIKIGFGLLFLAGGNGKILNDVSSIAILLVSLIPIMSSFLDSSHIKESLKLRKINNFNNTSFVLYMSRFLWVLEPHNSDSIKVQKDMLKLLKSKYLSISDHLKKFEVWVDYIVKNCKIIQKSKKIHNKQVCINNESIFSLDKSIFEQLQMATLFAKYLIKKLDATEKTYFCNGLIEKIIFMDSDTNLTGNDFVKMDLESKNCSITSKILLLCYKTVDCWILLNSVVVRA
ncbi:hypothetical protein BB561_003153 [Smittium simulii]|uniref:Anaphase-promoting complex subunit 1 N-terminal domain-containing protein n=1 Tax=Smittium simulii TaxID=133385 RepID=A0A2T9YMJ8_9FUNG|nr:hypothetical protein BB561_003153 [Smittium simulii]